MVRGILVAESLFLHWIIEDSRSLKTTNHENITSGKISR
ncbi:hypothetical protein XIS1_1650002 [Xenorhabdus innexi]|uniref:Uncharacterized protein n=1 Tax=Xenorhabdus innexi TaxID=290109 RepID=A0A1N6MV34_9GAMM|nr:hypothetical protein XIS1_1650002 [Xenorhabdus innexi]